MRIFAFVVFLLPSLAFAQPTPDVGTMVTDDCERARKANKVCVLDMRGETIERDGIGPDGEDIRTRFFAQFGSLVRIRKDFIGEILKSAQDVD
jgi:hypothetical protein